jgi:hypothetical protein
MEYLEKLNLEVKPLFFFFRLMSLYSELTLMRIRDFSSREQTPAEMARG